MRKQQIVARAARAYFLVAIPASALFFFAAYRGAVEVTILMAFLGFWGSIAAALVVALRELARYRRWLSRAPRSAR